MNELVHVALELATEWHAGEVRKYTDGEPYINHPLAVAEIIRSVPHVWEEVAAALLHDVLEPSPLVTEAVAVQRAAIIRERLGETVLRLVLEVTNPSRAEDGDRKARKAIDREHLAKASPGGQKIRLADMIHNLENIAERAPRFATLYAGEKKLMLPLTLAGDPVLHARATRLIDRILAG